MPSPLADIEPMARLAIVITLVFYDTFQRGAGVDTILCMLSVVDSLNEESPIVLATLGLILLASIATFSIITRRFTIRARELAIRQWARIHGAAVVDVRQIQKFPPRLEMLKSFNPRLRMLIEGPHWSLAELTTDAPAEAKGRTPRWRLLITELTDRSRTWPATGLRPVLHTVSLIDRLGLSSFPSLSSGDEFVIFGSESAAAEALAASAAQAVLPPEIGLVLIDRLLVLDCSCLKIQAGEWERMLNLAEKLNSVLTPSAKSLPVRP
jgi:hypothetical protein